MKPGGVRPSNEYPDSHFKPAEEAFIVTVGVPHEKRNTHCRRVLELLERAGYRAGQTSNEALIVAAHQASQVAELANNDPEEGDSAD